MTDTTEQPTKVNHWIEWTPAFDRRDEGYGIHGVELRAYLRGEHATMQFVLYTDWQLPHIKTGQGHPSPADVGYHAYEAVNEWQEHPSQKACHVLGGVPCYYDGSGLQAYQVFALFVKYGEEGLWWALAWYYRRWVCDDDNLPDLPKIKGSKYQ